MDITDKLKKLYIPDINIEVYISVFEQALSIGDLPQAKKEAGINWTDEQFLWQPFKQLYMTEREVKNRVISSVENIGIDKNKLDSIVYTSPLMPSSSFDQEKSIKLNEIMFDELRDFLGIKTPEYDYVLGKIDKRYNLANPSRFVIYKHDDTLLMYVMPESDTTHKTIAERFKLEKENILGGGSYRITDVTIEFHDCSDIYGSVPKEVMIKIAPKLVSYLKENFSEEIASQNINMAPFFANNSGVWRELGFSVP